jgi:hypothetical protein
VSATNTVQVTYRHVELAAAAPLSERGDGSFRLTLDAPPPVKTVVSIAHGGTTRALEVVEVIETAGDGSARGCVLREVGLERLPDRRPHAVGSEHLPDGALGAAEGDAPPPTTGADATVDDGYGAHMAVPAPVVSDDASEAHDVGGDEANGDDSGGNGDDSGSDASSDANGDSGSASDSGSGRKKRRGRQRK